MNHQVTKTPSRAMSSETDEIAKVVVDAAYVVHRTLGPGLLESVYELCLVHESTKRWFKVERQVSLPVVYDSIHLNAGLRLDIIVEHRVVVEFKAIDSHMPVHEAQLLTCLKLSGHRLGLLINFNVPPIKQGIRRMAL